MTAEEAKRAILEGLGGRGDKFRCPIPTHGRGRGDVNPSASVEVSPSGKLLVACPCCEQSALLDELKSRGFWTSTGSRAGWTLTKTWEWLGPDGCRDAKEYDTPDGRERRWKGKDGIKPKRLVYPVCGNHDLPGHTYVGPILFVEGAKTAEAAFKLTGLPAFGFASSTAKKNGAAGQLPDDDVLLWAGVECGAEFWIVPDNDPPGRKAGAILAQRLQQLWPRIPVRWVDPSKLVEAPANGWDLADWIDPPADAAERIRAAIGEPPAPPKAATAPPAPPTGTPPASGEVVESEHHLAELFARERGGQWRCQIERDLWLEWRGAGWEPAFPGHILDVLGLFGRERLQRISKGEVVPDPRRGGKAEHGNGIREVCPGDEADRHPCRRLGCDPGPDRPARESTTRGRRRKARRAGRDPGGSGVEGPLCSSSGPVRMAGGAMGPAPRGVVRRPGDGCVPAIALRVLGARQGYRTQARSLSRAGRHREDGHILRDCGRGG